MVIKKFEYNKVSDYLLNIIPDVGFTVKKIDNKNVFYITKELNKVFINFVIFKL